MLTLKYMKLCNDRQTPSVSPPVFSNLFYHKAGAGFKKFSVKKKKYPVKKLNWKIVKI